MVKTCRGHLSVRGIREPTCTALNSTEDGLLIATRSLTESPFMRPMRTHIRRVDPANAKTPMAAASLGMLPRELVDMITRRITAIRDMGAWSLATGLPTTALQVDAARRGLLQNGERAVMAGAPVPIVEALLAHNVGDAYALLPVACKSGRTDAVKCLLVSLYRTERWTVDERGQCTVRLSTAYDRAVKAAINHDHGPALGCLMDGAGLFTLDDFVSGNVAKAAAFCEASGRLRCAAVLCRRLKARTVGACPIRSHQFVVAVLPPVLFYDALQCAAAIFEACPALWTDAPLVIEHASAVGAFGVARWIIGNRPKYNA
ncbi:hypothetical protein TW95_gp0652 [Pandoravirus inopinatum]|uniref:Uncharacterized protein n=1 Tax=Pandoravirus inopinatum TaxID=1605721 RepID=A0A0B5J976_9VIRU|nr:hypothetical protein TW95_gp0652 [Pandoravirus inopinatum]AJF97386.1 hypothetical protein [Pandoravirus inopinatum]